MDKDKIKTEEDIEDLDLDVDDVSLDLDLDDDIVIEDDSDSKKEEVGIQIKIKDKKESVVEEPSDIDETQALIDELKEEAPVVEKKTAQEELVESNDGLDVTTSIFALRTTANREEQVLDFLTSNAEKKNFAIYSIIRAHGMRGYVFVEADSRDDVEQAIQGVPYARGLLPSEIQYNEIEHMLEQVKKDVNIKQNDIVEIISGPFKRENAKIIRVDKSKEDVVVELLEAAVPIPITLKMDSVKVIRRETGNDED